MDQTDPFDMSGSTNESIEQIRDILFGVHLKKIKERISDLEASVGSIQKTLTDLSEQIDQVNVQQVNRTEKLGDEVQQQVNQLKSELDSQIKHLKNEHVDRHLLGQALQELGQKLNQDSET
jgi:peptidoglycan hydrolase CwlO-like protein